MLDDSRRQQIEEEEKLRHKVRSNEKSKSCATTCLGGLIFFILILCYVWISGDSSVKSTPSPSPADSSGSSKAEQAAKTKETVVSEVSPIYCKNHQKIRLAKVQKLIDAGFPMFDGIGNLTDDQCKTIISKLYDIDSDKDNLMRVADSKVWIRQDYRFLIYSWGVPDNGINSTTTFSGTSQQWVYGSSLDGANYVYIDNGTVTSYQQ